MAGQQKKVILPFSMTQAIKMETMRSYKYSICKHEVLLLSRVRFYILGHKRLSGHYQVLKLDQHNLR